MTDMRVMAEDLGLLVVNIRALAHWTRSPRARVRYLLKACVTPPQCSIHVRHSGTAAWFAAVATLRGGSCFE